MNDVGSIVQPSASSIMAIESDASIDRLCSLLIECERAQRRYQWASGFLLVTLMAKPDAPKRPSAFADWLTAKTGMRLTQNEIQRRVTVYNFYGSFANERVIELIERVGLRIAYDARRSIEHKQPDRACAVLESCIDTRNGQVVVDAPGQQEPAKPKAKQTDKLRQRAMAAAKPFNGQDWVPLDLVIRLLAAAGH